VTRPKPLKGKLTSPCGCQPRFDNWGASKEDIRSAVEWLIKEMRSCGYQQKTIESLILQAFEDVMKE
jgi:hypothetical protein